MELVLFVDFKDKEVTEFEVFVKIRPEWNTANSIIIVDYNYRPWPQKGGNLLW